MRKACSLFLLCCFAAAVQSQMPAAAPAPDDAAFNSVYAQRSIPVITGRLLFMSKTEIKNLVITYTVLTPFASFQKRKTATIGPDGSFRLLLENALPYQQVWFGVGDLFYAGLYVNTRLYVELDMKKIKAAKELRFNGDGVRYLGADGNLTSYMNNYVLYKRPEQLMLSDSISTLLFSSRAAAVHKLPVYQRICDSIKQLRDSYIAGHPSPYAWLLENEQLSDYYGQLCILYRGIRMDDGLWQKLQQHKSRLQSNNGALFYTYLAAYIGSMPGGRVSTSWKDVAALPDLVAYEKALIDSLRNSETLQPSYPYTAENIQQWTKQLQPRIQKIALAKRLDNTIHRIDSLFPAYRADYIKLRLDAGTDLTDQQLELERLLGSMHTGWCITVVKNEYKQTLANINKINTTLASSAGGIARNSFGRPLVETSFGASLYKAGRIKAVDFLAKLQQNFPGKALVIDLWATWCLPCLGEMPHSKKLQLGAKDLPVVFVYLCTTRSSSESKWKAKVVQLQQPGIHFFIDETLDAELASYFSFSGYPGYAFINRTGHYQPGAFKWLAEIKNAEMLANLVNK